MGEWIKQFFTRLFCNHYYVRDVLRPSRDGFITATCKYCGKDKLFYFLDEGKELVDS